LKYGSEESAGTSKIKKDKKVKGLQKIKVGQTLMEPPGDHRMIALVEDFDEGGFLWGDMRRLCGRRD